jgi:uncharacterized membrane protein
MTTNRLEAFSDGVFAIAITLLILAVAVPPGGGAFGPKLLGLWPSYVAYAVSFVVIGAIWINHHGMFQHIVRADGTLLLLNLLNLMVVAFLPFPTAVLASAFLQGTDASTAVALYGGTLAVLGILVNVMWQYAARGRRPIGPHLTEAQADQIGRALLVGPAVYGVATLIGLLVPWIAVLLYLVVNVFYLWPGRVNEGAAAVTGERDASSVVDESEEPQTSR